VLIANKGGEKMNKKILVIAVVLLLAALLVSPLIGTVAAWIGHNEENEQKECKPRGGWTLVTNGRAVSAYPELREYLWQKNAAMAPNGPYDKIALHRLVKADSKPIGVIFITPGLYCSGEQLLSVFANTENNNQPIYWANRGFDVYTIDYRTHFVPSTLSPDQLSFMAEWGLDQFVNDVKEAVDKAKQVSHTNKIFIAGESLGGAMAMFYAAKYWREDLKGIILLDSAGIVKNTATTNTFNLPAAVDAMKASGNYAYEMPYLPMPGGYCSAIRNDLLIPICGLASRCTRRIPTRNPSGATS
jgi:pimeloyl-ACP methyl ester carboxylesterase